MNSNFEKTLRGFVHAEMDDGVLFEDLLEEFDLDPEDVFVFLFNSGLISEERLQAYILDIEE